MKKNITKFTLYTATALMIFTASAKVKSCKDKSKKFTDKVIEYTTNFEEDTFLIAAHRGYSSLAVENTIDAIDIASQTGYIDYIEIDTRLTKDNKLVLAHDNLVITKNKRKLRICDENYNFLKNKNFSYRANSLSIQFKNIFNTENGNILIGRSKNLESKSYEISSLKEGIKACNNKKILLDLKFENNTEEFILSLEKELKNINTDNIIFQSDDLLPLLCLQKKHPEYNYLAIIKKKSDLDYALLFDNIGIKKTLVNEELVDNLISENKKIAIWTLNNPNEINEVIEKTGTHYKDIIYISDYPDVLGTCLSEKEKRREK